MAKLGSIQIDFLLAAGVFILLFAFVIMSLTNHLSATKIQTESMDIKSEAFSLLSITETNKTGLSSEAYRFYVIVNNSQSYWIDQAKPVADLINETVNINFSYYGLKKDINSTLIKDEDGNNIDYQITSIDNISFAVNVSANKIKVYTIYFDDDSNFTSRSKIIAGTNNLTEKITQPQKLNLIRYRSFQILNSTNYSSFKNSTGMKNDFQIILIDNTIIFNYGLDTPRTGDVSALQRYVIYQNSTGDINNGIITVKVFKI